MTDGFVQETEKLNWRFPRTFWFANAAELFERAAFYGAFIFLVYYLTERVGFTDKAAGVVTALFASVLYLLPTFMGTLADRIGFRRALMLAFTLLTGGYWLLGAFQLKSTVLVSLGLIMFGGAIVKPVISGTVAKCSDENHRARAFSIFYMVVNIGAFYGKTVADPLRERFGLEYINFYAAAMAFIAMVCVTFFYRDVDREPTSKTLREAWKGLVKVLNHVRFLALILIVAGFWVIQGQLYASMVKYYLRLVGEGKPAWLANINPLVVIILVVPITHLVRRFKPENSITIGLLIIPLTAVAIALGPVFGPNVGSTVDVGLGITMHPITLMLIIGIGLQGLAECFLSPKWLEYASRQAPKGEEGLYLGYQHLTTFFAWLFGFGISGYLLAWWCPDPKTLSPEVQAQYAAAMESGGRLPEAYAHAHYIWYVFAGVGVVAFAAMLVFKFVTNAIDRRRDAASGTAS